MLCVNEFPQVRDINLNEIVQVLKAFTIVTSENLNLHVSTILWSVTF